jgi:hypothetical protein
MRLRVLAAKLLTQIDAPADAIASAGLSRAGAAKRIGAPTFVPDPTAMRVTVPRSPLPADR